MSTRQRSNVLCLVLGGALVALGFVLASAGPTRAAFGQTVAVDPGSPFLSGNAALITASADGTTLHFWSLAPPGTEKIVKVRGYNYQGSRSKTEP